MVGPSAYSDGVTVPSDGDRPIAEAEPERIWLAIDARFVMTERGKARRNRQRDISSFADIMHRHHPGAVSGGLLLINTAERFRSPLRDDGDITAHENIEPLVEQTIEIFEDIDRAAGEISPNVDGVAYVVVEHTNMDDGHETRLVSEPPAPQPGAITNYREFLGILVEILGNPIPDGRTTVGSGSAGGREPGVETEQGRDRGSPSRTPPREGIR